MHAKGISSTWGKRGEFTEEDYFEGSIGHGKWCGEVTLREEGIIDYVKNLDLQLQRMIYLKETGKIGEELAFKWKCLGWFWLCWVWNVDRSGFTDCFWTCRLIMIWSAASLERKFACSLITLTSFYFPTVSFFYLNPLLAFISDLTVKIHRFLSFKITRKNWNFIFIDKIKLK